MSDIDRLFDYMFSKFAELPTRIVAMTAGDGALVVQCVDGIYEVYEDGSVRQLMRLR